MLFQLPPEPIRPERLGPEAMKEAWKPSWRCFACHDTGIITGYLVFLVVPEYSDKVHKNLACKNPSCRNIAPSSSNPNYDHRFSIEICRELDKISREDWTRTIENKFINFKALAEMKKMPGDTGRTANDDREILQRKAEIESITHEQWVQMNSSYLGVDEDVLSKEGAK